MKTLNMLLDFLLPSPCVVCGRLPKPLCGDCEPAAGFQMGNIADFRIYFSNELAGDFELIMKSYKDKSRMALEKHLVQLLDELIMEIQKREQFDCYALPPKNPSNFRRRGFVPIERLVSKTSLAKLRRVFLKKTRNIQEQRQLSLPARIRNTSLAFEAIPGRGRVLLVDDVATTGATVLEMRRSLAAAGYQPVASCVLARRFGIGFDSPSFRRNLEAGLGPNRR